MLKRMIALMLSIVMLMAVLAGCGAAETLVDTEPATEAAPVATDAPDASVETEAAAPAELPTIRVGVMGGMLKAGLVVLARDLGIDEEEGFNLELVDVQSSADALTSIITGKDEMDVWSFQVMPSCNFIANGADIKIFGGSVAEGGAMICAKGHAEEYKDLENFKGKTILGIRGETGFITFIGLLVNAGFDVTKDINIVWTNAPAVLEGVAKGEGDVGFLPIEYTYFEDENINAEVVCHVGDLAENYICCRLTTSSQILEERRDDFVKLIKAQIRAYHVYQTDHETTIEVLSAYSGQTPEFVEDNIYNSCIKFTPDPYSDAIGPFYEVLRTMDFFDDPENAPDVYDHLDISLYQEALEEIMAEYPDDAVYEELYEIFLRQNSKMLAG
ncbi:MAG: ABC transporter substrate-binding protein [Oscillospiraceae bacterium]|nr:ABC transporter substrate-binding protein [Oscillospiraceae bacterium]